MIEINLLPEELRKRRKETKIVSEIPKIFIIRVIGLVLLVHLTLAILSLIRVGNLNKLNRLQPEFQEKKKVLDNLNKEIEILEKNKSALNQLKGKRLVWSKKLNLISDNIPKGVWLRELSLSKDKFKIEGSCVSRRLNETERIRDFLNKLRADLEFFQEFKNLELGSLTRRSIKGQDVIDFIFLGEFK